MHETNPQSSTPWKVLFVCLGNICRSPAAEGIMKSLVSHSGLSDQIYVDSAGTSSYHIGALPDARMRAAASRRGYDLSSRARSILPQDLRDFDLVIAMDRDNYRAIHGLTSDAAPNVRLLSEFLDEQWPQNVPDPYYGGDDGFEFVLDMLEAACPNILSHYAKMDRPKHR